MNKSWLLAKSTYDSLSVEENSLCCYINKRFKRKVRYLQKKQKQNMLQIGEHLTMLVVSI
jgi:hypothetical protein